VHESSDWTSNIVIVRWKDKIRIGLDPHKLNQAIKTCQYQILTVEEILPEIFSILNAKNGFWHLKLDENSKKILGVECQIQILRIPFGISSVAEICQHQVFCFLIFAK
jgi:hypothetical protein